MRPIDAFDSTRVKDVLDYVREEFRLNIHNQGHDESSLVLSYNGFDLKPAWTLAEVSISPGSILHCTDRQTKMPELYVHCGFNGQVLKLFDSSITQTATIGALRTNISNQLGLPLSVFCLEKYDSGQRLYDEIALITYDIQRHDHVYLKVWRELEKFVVACTKGFSAVYINDDLVRHYQLQVALHIAAFYGRKLVFVVNLRVRMDAVALDHTDLASSVMQLGARSDQPVGEHPSRQWTFDASSRIVPETLKCPMHVAIERGNTKIVDLFARLCVLSTQVRHPLTGYLPYRLALKCAFSSSSAARKERYKQIYFYLHEKQFTLKIPLNATGEYVSSLLTQTFLSKVVRRPLATYTLISLPFFCRLLR